MFLSKDEGRGRLGNKRKSVLYISIFQMEVQGGSKTGQMESLRCKIVSLETPADPWEVLKNGCPPQNCPESKLESWAFKSLRGVTTRQGGCFDWDNSWRGLTAGSTPGSWDDKPLFSEGALEQHITVLSQLQMPRFSICEDKRQDLRKNV